MATFYEAYRAKEFLSKKMLNRKGIVGIGVGFADPQHPKKGAGIIVYTDNIGLAAKHRLLNTLNTAISIKKTPVPVRVITTGPAFSGAALSAGAIAQTEYRRRVRPVPAGYSVSGQREGSGTAGLIVTRGGQLFLASNNHVLGIDNASASFTVQPGLGDGGTVANDRIGFIREHVPLKKVGDNFLDAAISMPFSNNLLEPRYGARRRRVHGVVDPGVGMRLFSESRTSGHRLGTVEAVHMDFQVRMGGNYGNLGTIQFRNQTVIRGHFLGGDSGVVWLWRDTFGNPAVAMSHAGFSGGRRAISFPMSWFNQMFGTQVAQPAGHTGHIRTVSFKGNYKYAQPLTKKELSSIKVVRTAKRK